jgi:hypothetical protein
MWITRPAALILGLALLAGCGTTVPGVDGAAAPVNAGSGLSAPAPITSAGTPTMTSGDGVPIGGEASSGPGTVSGPGASISAVPAGSSGFGSGGSASTAGVPPVGRGYDAQHVYLGFPTNNDVNQAANTGLGATNFGDQPTQIKAVVADVNHRGGILGRTVVPIFHDIKTANLETDPTTQAEATCTAFTQDHKVVAIVNIVAGIDLPVFYSCLAKADTPLVSAGFVPADDQLFATYAPYLYKLTAASFTQLAPVWIQRLTAMGYFHGWNTTAGSPATGSAKIGLLYPSQQPQQRIFMDIKRRLQALGYKDITDYQYDASSLNAEASSMSSAVLHMRQAGVTHLMSSESDVLLFMEAADSQHYRPRYALTSYHAPAAQLQGFAPASQLAGSMGVGWLPSTDVDAGHNPGPVSSGETSCRKIMHDAGQDISAATAAVVAFALCDGIRLIAGGINLSHDPSSRGLHTGLAQLGHAFDSALTWRSGLATSRYAEPGKVREFAYNGSAYAYVSKTQYSL